MDPVSTFSCPTCSRKLNIPTAAMGKNIKCPACQTIFKITAQDGHEPTVAIDTSAGFTIRSRQDSPRGPETQDEENNEPPRRREVDRDDSRSRRDVDDDVGARPRRHASREDDESPPPRARRDEVEDRPRRRDYDDDDERDSRRRRRSNYDDDDDRDSRRRRRLDEAAASVAAPAIALLVLGILEVVISLLLSLIFMIAPLSVRKSVPENISGY